MIERLTAEDEVMLWPDQIWPQDIGALAVLDGNNLLDPDGRFRIEAVTEMVTGRLHLVPRFRQLLYLPPRRLGGPLWVDSPTFNVGDHIQVVPLASPGDEAQLLAAVEHVRRVRLDRSRPLWDMWFLPGLAEGRIGLFVRMHHSLADGMAGLAAISTFLDLTPDATPPTPQPWTAAAAPTSAELFVDNLMQHAHRLGRVLCTLAHPATSVQRALAAWPALRELLAQPTLRATSLDRLVGPDRTLALVRGSLDLVKEAAHTFDASVNDVLLSATAGGMSTLLGSRGEKADGGVVRTYVPVSLHQGSRAQARGNLIAQMVVPLPIEVMDPGRRLRQIAVETRLLKARTRPSLGELPHRGFAGRAFLKLIDRQKVNVTSTNIPGPEAPLYLAGAKLLEVFPMVQLIGTVSLAVGAMSYAGQFNIMVVADRDSCPDLGIFAVGLQKELDVICTQRAGVHPPPAD